jgi:hypothetical protein
MDMEHFEHDQLYVIFRRLLLTSTPNFTTDQEFIEQVTTQYLTQLSRTAQAPSGLLKNLRPDVIAEVRDMLRAQIYGFHSIKEFRSSESFERLKQQARL